MKGHHEWICARPIFLLYFYNQYTSSRGACNASYDTPFRVEALRTCRVLIAGTVHSHKVMRSSWVKWCWKWIISSLSPNGTVGTFLPDLVLRGHPSSTTAWQWLHSSQAQPDLPPPPNDPTKAPDRRPASNPIIAIQVNSSKKYYGFSILGAHSLEAKIQPQIATTEVQLLFGQVTICICW